MKAILQLLAVFGGIVFLVALHVGSSYILPYPWSKVNLILTALILVMMWRNTGLIVWIAFFAYFFIELYTTTPFGVVLFSGTISILLTYWLYKHWFTNRSWYSATALCFFSLTIFRLIYMVCLVLLGIFDLITFIPWTKIITTWLWEIALTLPLMAITYFILSRFSKNLGSLAVERSIFRV